MPDLPEIRCEDCPRLLTDPVSRARRRGSQHYREWLAEHPELAPPRRRRPAAVPKPRPARGPIPDQLDLFEIEPLGDRND